MSNQKIKLGVNIQKKLGANSYTYAIVEFCNFVRSVLSKYNLEPNETIYRAFYNMEVVNRTISTGKKTLAFGDNFSTAEERELITEYTLPDEVKAMFLGKEAANSEIDGAINRSIANIAEAEKKEKAKQVLDDLCRVIYARKPNKISFNLGNVDLDLTDYICVNEDTKEAYIKDEAKLCEEYATIYANAHGLKVIATAKKACEGLQELADVANNFDLIFEVFTLTPDGKVKISDSINYNEV